MSYRNGKRKWYPVNTLQQNVKAAVGLLVMNIVFPMSPAKIILYNLPLTIDNLAPLVASFAFLGLISFYWLAECFINVELSYCNEGIRLRSLLFTRYYPYEAVLGFRKIIFKHYELTVLHNEKRKKYYIFPYMFWNSGIMFISPELYEIDELKRKFRKVIPVNLKRLEEGGSIDRYEAE